MKTKAEQIQALVAIYRADGNAWPATAHDLEGWALRNCEWEPSRSDLISQCASEFSRAMREEHVTDPQGRRVRSKHAARFFDGEHQRTLWADIRTAPREHMEIALKQRRQQIVGDCAQLRRDADSYNENACQVDPIQLSFDFTEDLEELEALEALSAA